MLQAGDFLSENLQTWRSTSSCVGWQVIPFGYSQVSSSYTPNSPQLMQEFGPTAFSVSSERQEVIPIGYCTG